MVPTAGPNSVTNPPAPAPNSPVKPVNLHLVLAAIDVALILLFVFAPWFKLDVSYYDWEGNFFTLSDLLRQGSSSLGSLESLFGVSSSSSSQLTGLAVVSFVLGAVPVVALAIDAFEAVKRQTPEWDVAGFLAVLSLVAALIVNGCVRSELSDLLGSVGLGSLSSYAVSSFSLAGTYWLAMLLTVVSIVLHGRANPGE